VPEPIARLVMGNLAKDPAERSADARTFARELTLAARDAGLHLDSMQGGVPRGDLRLLSKQRTRQHEFSPELKAQIAAMPPSSQNGRGRAITQFEEVLESHGLGAPPAPPAPSYPPLRASRPDPTEVGAPLPPQAGAVRPARTEVGEALLQEARNSRPGLTEVPADIIAASVTQLPDDTITGSLEHECGRISVRDLRELGALEKPGPTIQGSPLDSDSDYVDPRASQPMLGARSSRPGTSQPGVPSAGPSQPGHSQPGHSQPGHSQPGHSQPGHSQPGHSQPGPSSSPPSSLPHEIPQRLERQRRGRTIALVIAVLVLVPVGAFAAVKLFAFRGSQVDPIATGIESAQEAMEKRAWDAPPGANVKEITDRLLNESPGDRRVLGLRRAAADGILTDALALRDSGRADEALRLARLALAFAPDLAPAQKLTNDIERADSPSVEMTSPPPGSSSAKPRAPGKPGPLGSGKPGPSAKATSGEPGLAPPTPPDPTPPGPNSSRPWL